MPGVRRVAADLATQRHIAVTQLGARIDLDPSCQPRRESLMHHVAIVGAGIAGLTAARHLEREGIKTTVFEKSKGLGGRMATRRTADFRFDHGAQYFSANGKSFRAQVAEWSKTGVAAPWSGDRYVGTPGMTAPARDLASGTTVVHGITVSHLARGPGGGWTVHDRAGFIDAPGNGCYDAVVLAVPAPQALPVAASSGVNLDGLSSARIAPCWALMIGADQAIKVPGPSIRPDHPIIAWIADNASKPGRDTAGSAIVVHATPEWSADSDGTWTGIPEEGGQDSCERGQAVTLTG